MLLSLIKVCEEEKQEFLFSKEEIIAAIYSVRNEKECSHAELVEIVCYDFGVEPPENMHNTNYLQLVRYIQEHAEEDPWLSEAELMYDELGL